MLFRAFAWACVRSVEICDQSLVRCRAFLGCTLRLVMKARASRSGQPLEKCWHSASFTQTLTWPALLNFSLDVQFSPLCSFQAHACTINSFWQARQTCCDFVAGLQAPVKVPSQCLSRSTLPLQEGHLPWGPFMRMRPDFSLPPSKPSWIWYALLKLAL